MRSRSLLALVLVATFVAGCGSDGSASDQAVEARIERERADAATKAVQAQKLKDLQGEVERLKKRRSSAARTTAPPSTAAAQPQAASRVSTGERTFHAPSGNVSCRIADGGAACAVASIGRTFVLPAGGQGKSESGAQLSRGSGSLAPYGTSVSGGSVTCVIPASSEARGITCSDAATGHGFEASSVPARQAAF
jgi:hypothetical protein